jgi:pimeloyl-ACP methyl ester carboxylesterase
MSSDLISVTSIAGFPAITTPRGKDRPPLLFIHGAFVTHDSYAGWMTELARRGWGGVAASRRGRLGVGPERAAGLTISDYLDDTLKVIDALDETPVVVGHSLGGLIAQKIAELGLCRAAVLLAPAPAAMLTAQAVAFPSLLPMFPKMLAGKPLLPPAGSCARIVLNKIPEAERPSIHGELVHESGKVYREMVFGTYKIDAAKVKCPMLVIGAEEDRIVSKALVALTAKRYGAELRMYKNHAHWFLAEPGWEKIAVDAADWLDRHVAGNVTNLRAA